MDDKTYYITLANYAEQHKYYIVMSDAMKNIVNINPNLSHRERVLLYDAYDNILSNKFDSWSTSSGEEKEQFKELLLHYCEEITELIDDKLLPNSQTTSPEVFYYKMKAQFNEYLVKTADENERQKYIDICHNAYINAYSKCKFLSPISDLRLTVSQRFSVFCYNILKQPNNAIKIAGDTYIEAVVENDRNRLVEIIKENINKWSKEQNITVIFEL